MKAKPSSEGISLRRHHDDSFFDSFQFHAPRECVARLYDSRGALLLSLTTEPRYKMSGLSGNEWRVSVSVRYLPTGETSRRAWPQAKAGRSSHSMGDACHYLPAFLFQSSISFSPFPVVVSAWRKGRCLWEKKYVSLLEAACCFRWDLLIASENGDKALLPFSDEMEKAVCQQPGCAQPKTRIYRYKKRQVTPSERMMASFRWDFESRHIWFCEEHARRGDAGLEDCDANYEAADGALARKARTLQAKHYACQFCKQSSAASRWKKNKCRPTTRRARGRRLTDEAS